MSHLPAVAPGSQSNDGNAPYASLNLSQDEAGSCEDDSSPPKQDAKNASPRTLRVRSQIIKILLIDLVSVLLSIAIFVLAVLGYSARGNTFGSREQKLLDTARIVHACFPCLSFRS